MASLTMAAVPFADYPKAVRVSMRGGLDATNELEFEDFMKRLQKDGFHIAVLDMSDVIYVSSGVGSLVAVADRLEKAGGGLALVNVRPKVKIVFEMLGLNSYFKICASESEVTALVHRLSAAQPAPLEAGLMGLTLRATPVQGRIGTLRIDMAGHLDATNAIEFDSYMEGLFDDGWSRFVFDAAEMKYLSSTGLDSFVALADHLERDGGGLAIVRVPSGVKGLFDALGLNSFFRIFAGIERALEFFSNSLPAKPLVMVSRPAAGGKVMVVRISGAMDATVVKPFDANMERLYRKGARNFALDISQVTHLLETADGILSAWTHKLEAEGGGLALFNVPRKIQVVIDSLGFSSQVRICGTEAEALDYLEHRHQPLPRSSKPCTEYLSLHAARIDAIPGAVRVTMGGALDAVSMMQYESFVGQLREDGYRHFLFDIAQTKYINETGLGSFIATADNLEKTGGGMALINVHPKVKVVFDMLGLNSFFRIFPTEEKALDFLSSPAAASGGAGSEPQRRLEHLQPPPSTPASLELTTSMSGRVAEAKLCGTVGAIDLPLLNRRYNLLRTPNMRYALLDVTGLEGLDPHAERWLVQLSGELVAKGGCVALAGLSENVRQQLIDHEVDMAFEHYDLVGDARVSLQRVLEKQVAYVQEIRRHDGLLAVTVRFGQHLPPAAGDAVSKSLEAVLTELMWVQYLLLDFSRVSTLAPEVEMRINRVADALASRKGQVFVCGASNAVHEAMQRNAGSLYRFYADAEGARHEIESEFLEA